MMKQRSICLLLLLLLAGMHQLSAQVYLNLLSQMHVQDSSATDCWGYYDAQTQREYAIVGSWNAVSIIDVTDPVAPFYVAFIDTIKGFDVKVWDHYLYAVGGNVTGTGRVIDIADPANPVVVGQFPDAHNLFIDDKGYMVASYDGLFIYDLNNTPAQPQLVFQDTSQAEGHDAYVRNDTLYFFEGYSGVWIMDVADRTQPVLLQVIQHPNMSYAHSGWMLDDGRHLLVCDELARHPQPDITVWDISNLGNPTKVGEFGDSTAIVHNTFVVGDLAFTSYYMNGLRVFDVTDPTNLQVVAEYATYPDTSYEAFNGAFGAYPYAPSGNVYVSDMTYGLFVFGVDSVPLGASQPAMPARMGLDLGIAPNPSNGLMSLSLPSFKGGQGLLQVLDTQGRMVWQQTVPAGTRTHSLDLSSLPAGLYTLTLQTADFRIAEQLILSR